MADSNVVTMVSNVGNWQQFGTRYRLHQPSAQFWVLITEHFRWELSWSLQVQWRLDGFRKDKSSWDADPSFAADYRPDDSMRPDHAYDEAQGKGWADALVALMTPILEAEARGKHDESSEGASNG